MTLPRIIPRAEHPISRGYIDPDALRVLYRLHRAGHKAYLVGGSVRDLMTGRTPKDFDVGTDARPQEIRRLFRNSRIIGRRFRLAHILFENGKVVEVSTFRRTPDAVSAEPAAEGDEDLLIRSDNTFGTPEQDAVRRDFTINGLFYDIATYAVLDYVGGVDDLAARLVRTIGEPSIRLREDPVRMLRACEFAARLGFSMTPDLRTALEENRKEILKSAAPRVTEELLDPLRRGWGTATYRLWSETGLLEALLPDLDAEVRSKAGGFGPVFWRMLEESDRRKAAGNTLGDATLLGMLVLPLVFAAIRARAHGGGRIDGTQILLVLENVVNPLAARMALPNLTVHTLKQCLDTMGLLTETRPETPAARRLVGKHHFPAAVALLSLYAAASGRYREVVAAWEDVDALLAAPGLVDREEAPALFLPDTGPRPAPRRPRRRRGGRRPAPVPASA
jgi:poly(A) polymerase